MKYIICSTVSIIAVFFYIYSIQFGWSPGGFGTRVWMGVFGFINLIIQYKQWILLKINKYFLKMLVLLLIILCISIVSIIINGLYYKFPFDITFITYFPQMITVALAGYFISMINNWNKDKINFSKNIFIIAVSIQMILSVILYLFPNVAEIINDIQVMQAIDSELINQTSSYRLSGFGSKFFGAGIVNSFALILIINIIRNQYINKKNIYLLTAAFLLILIVGMMMSRTTMVGVILAIVYLMLPFESMQRKNNNRKYFISYFLFLIFCMILIGSLLNDKIFNSIDPLINWGFEIFINYNDNGKIETNSTLELEQMYKNVHSDIPFFLGDGLFLDPINKESYYKYVDIGYIRLVYYFGILGTTIYFLLQAQVIRMSALDLIKSEGHKFTIICLALVLILNLKGFADIFIYSFYLFACTFGKETFFINKTANNKFYK